MTRGKENEFWSAGCREWFSQGEVIDGEHDFYYR
jgi:hypothetical protein